MGREEEIEEFIPSLNMYRGKNLQGLDWGARLYSKEDLDNYFLPKGYDFEAEKRKKEQEEAEKRKKEQEEKIKKEQEEAEYIRDNGFTAGKSELQRGKILKDLNRQVWYKQVNSGNPTSAKKMIEELVDKGFKPTIDTFRTTRKILGERFDKDSNVKILKDKNGAYYKLNKTEYEYAKFLTSNK